LAEDPVSACGDDDDDIRVVMLWCCSSFAGGGVGRFDNDPQDAKYLSSSSSVMSLLTESAGEQ
jgi:hypothetical protein